MKQKKRLLLHGVKNMLGMKYYGLDQVHFEKVRCSCQQYSTVSHLRNVLAVRTTMPSLCSDSFVGVEKTQVLVRAGGVKGGLVCVYGVWGAR